MTHLVAGTLRYLICYSPRAVIPRTALNTTQETAQTFSPHYIILKLEVSSYRGSDTCLHL